jgi:hypothetical protein
MKVILERDSIARPGTTQHSWVVERASRTQEVQWRGIAMQEMCTQGGGWLERRSSDRRNQKS